MTQSAGRFWLLMSGNLDKSETEALEKIGIHRLRCYSGSIHYLFEYSGYRSEYSYMDLCLMKADKAVKIIKKGLERNYARISFPFPLNLGIWYLAQLPFCIASPIASLFGYGIGKKKSDNNTKNGL